MRDKDSKSFVVEERGAGLLNGQIVVNRRLTRPLFLATLAVVGLEHLADAASRGSEHADQGDGL